MKIFNSDIKIIQKSLLLDDHLNTLIVDLDQSFKQDDVYTIVNNKLVKQDSSKNCSKNIFLNYSKSVHSLYVAISNILKEVCLEYEINQEKQRYMIYGKVSKYNEMTNPSWYDFPGTNKPALHGFYFPYTSQCFLNIQNNEKNKQLVIKSKDIIFNKPTDIMNIKTDIDIDVIEFYIMPIVLLKHNEPGIWCPIL